VYRRRQRRWRTQPRRLLAIPALVCRGPACSLCRTRGGSARRRCEVGVLFYVDGQILELVEQGDEGRHRSHHDARGPAEAVVQVHVGLVQDFEHAAPAVSVCVGLVLGRVIVWVEGRHLRQHQEFTRHVVQPGPCLPPTEGPCRRVSSRSGQGNSKAAGPHAQGGGRRAMGRPGGRRRRAWSPFGRHACALDVGHHTCALISLHIQAAQSQNTLMSWPSMSVYILASLSVGGRMLRVSGTVVTSQQCKMMAKTSGPKTRAATASSSVDSISLMLRTQCEDSADDAASGHMPCESHVLERSELAGKRVLTTPQAVEELLPPDELLAPHSALRSSKEQSQQGRRHEGQLTSGRGQPKRRAARRDHAGRSATRPRRGRARGGG